MRTLTRMLKSRPDCSMYSQIFSTIRYSKEIVSSSAPTAAVSGIAAIEAAAITPAAVTAVIAITSGTGVIATTGAIAGTEATAMTAATGGIAATATIAPTSGSRSEEHTSELQSLMRITYAVFCLKKKKTHKHDKDNK